MYKEKKVQSKIWSDITESGKSIENFLWIIMNMKLEKIEQIIRIHDLMVSARKFLQMQGKHQETTTCRLCEDYSKRTMHLMSACPYLADSVYLKRYNKTLRVFYVSLAKKFGLLDPKLAWFNVHMRLIIENNEASVYWNIKMATHTTVEHSRPDLRVEWKKKQLIEVFGMAYPVDCNVIEKEQKDQGSHSAMLRLAKVKPYT